MFHDPSAEMPPGMTADHPMYSKTAEATKWLPAYRWALAGQVVGEWFDIHMLFVAHPKDRSQDLAVMDLAKELLRRAAAERGCDFGDVRVGSLHDLAAIKATLEKDASADIQRLLHEATAPLVRDPPFSRGDRRV